MKLNFRFSNLCGTVYREGNILFAPDSGNHDIGSHSVISPVGNRVTVFDITKDKSYTLAFENRKNIERIAISPSGQLLLSIDEDGRGVLVNIARQVIIHRQNFKEPVLDVQFSPNGVYFAITHARIIQIWKLPHIKADFTPLVLHRELTGPFDDVKCINWSTDSTYIVAGCKDMTVRLFSVDPVEGFLPCILSGHRDVVVGAWFGKGNSTIYSVSADGALFVWKRMEVSSEETAAGIDAAADSAKKKRKTARSRVWRTESKHYFKQNHAKVVSADFHQARGLLVVGFTTGLFGIWELPDFINIHSLSISQKKVNTVSISPSGDWIAFGCSKLGQLLVWEWQSESYVLKQQGHRHEMTCLCYSQDGQYVVTGGDDGKVKLWNTQSGYCFVTFSDHCSGVRAVDFSKKGQVVFSAGLDGTVRAFDMIRYRNFRTFTALTPVQFGCLAVDPSGEIVAAGSIDTFEVYVWSVQTGKLLDVLAGHSGPISCMSFSPMEGRLISGSWDQTVRTWDIYNRSLNTEAYEHTTEVLAMAFRPDGRQIATCTLGGQIVFWDIETGRQIGTIEGSRDISGGRKSTDKMTAANSSASKHFTSICYTVDGSCVIAGGNSKYVLIYDVASKAMLKKFQISHNFSLDGMHEYLNSKNMTEAGPIDLIDMTGDLSDLEDRLDKTLPGAKKGDLSMRADTRLEVRTSAVKFSPTGRTWAAASTEGLLLFTLDDSIMFDPFDLEIDITPDTIMEILVEGNDYLRALVLSFRLGEKYIINNVCDSIPPASVNAVVKSLPPKYFERFIKVLVERIDSSPRVQFNLNFAFALLRFHGQYLKDRNQEFAGSLRGLTKAIDKIYGVLSKVTNGNINDIQFIVSQMRIQEKKAAESLDKDGVTMEDILS